jgi:outer membrane protein
MNNKTGSSNVRSLYYKTSHMEEELKKQKNTNSHLAVTLLLAAGLIVLYILFFTNKESKKEPSAVSQPATINMTGSASTPIAFVDTDELLDKYDLVKVLSAQLEQDQKNKDALFRKKQREYEEEAAYFQESVQKQTISESSAQVIYEQLMLKQQSLYELQEQYSSELARKELEMTRVLLDSVKNYLARANQTYQFDYILNYSMAGTILHAKDTFDITQSVLQGLNQEYKAKNPDPK